MRLTLLISFFIWAADAVGACTGSSPTWTSTADLTSLSSCVSGADRGDTINVEDSGTEVWTGVLTLTKGVKLIGPGRDTLTIQRQNQMLQISPDSTAIANEEFIRVSGFTFDMNNPATSGLYMVKIAGAGTGGTKPFKNLRIDNNRFKNSSATTSDCSVIRTDGQVSGVIDSNIFDRDGVILKILGNNLEGDFTNSAYYPLSPSFGGSAQLFFEDNTITFSSDGSWDDPAWTESGQGGRLVMRYNSWDFDNVSTQTETQDIHGFQYGDSNPSTGTMASEYYGNTWANKAGYRWAYARAPLSLIFDNVVTGTQGSGIEVAQYPESCGNEAEWPSLGSGVTVQHETYIFNNTMNGSEITPAQSGTYQNCSIAENTNWWKLNTGSCTASSCTAGIGRGTSAPTGTCTTGTAYWVASTATPTVDSSVIQNGTLYRCVSTDTWESYYQPYTYPHPLRAESSTDNNLAMFLAQMAWFAIGVTVLLGGIYARSKGSFGRNRNAAAPARYKLRERASAQDS